MSTRPARPALRRRRHGRVVAGVASGIADVLAIDPLYVRLAFAVLAVASGVGVVAYVVLWLVLPDGGTGERLLDRGDGEADVVRGLAFGAIVLGAVLLLRNAGVWFPASLLWPVVFVAGGLAMVWRRDPKRQVGRAADRLSHTSQHGVAGLRDDARSLLAADDWSRRAAARVAAGALLVFVGASTFVATHGSFAAFKQGIVGAFVLFAGVALIVAPWLLRLLHVLNDERRERIRTEERAVLAAHLHDSVLQTLAIIQKRANEPREVVTLARRQERELRAWLYDGPDLGASRTFAEAIAATADSVEADHGVRIDVVQVGDVVRGDDDGRVDAIIAAAREAMVNAAKHAGVEDVSVYAEAADAGPGAREIEVFVRDRGIGFDPASVAKDRRGITDSVRARMERVGGRCEIESAPGEGTEVRLFVTVRGPSATPADAVPADAVPADAVPDGAAPADPVRADAAPDGDRAAGHNPRSVV